MKKWICLLLCLLMFGDSGCSIKIEDRSKPVQTEEIESVSDETYLVTHRETEGTCFYDVVRRDNEEKSAIVLFLHGFTKQKERMFKGAKALADAGYVAVVPDCAGHGENKRRETMNLYEIMMETVQSCDDILDYYRNSETADNQRFSIAGFSMGAMISLYYGAYSDNRPACVVSLFGTPDWENLFGGKVIYTECTDGEFTEMTDEDDKKELMRSLMRKSPDKNIGHLLELPILMINGEKDSLVPLSGVTAFAAKAQLYPNQLETVIRKDRRHSADEEDVACMVEFISEHMPPGEGEDDKG